MRNETYCARINFKLRNSVPMAQRKERRRDSRFVRKEKWRNTEMVVLMARSKVG